MKKIWTCGMMFALLATFGIWSNGAWAESQEEHNYYLECLDLQFVFARGSGQSLENENE